MHRTTVRALAAAMLAITLMIPAVSAAAVPTSGGWVASWLEAIADWFAPLERTAAHGEALSSTDPNGLTAPAPEDGGEVYPNTEPDGLTAAADPETEEDTLPNLDPNG